tara:strand:- start:673 stop:1206 length:534 start_codon:yes stop_codon:yes gene_type:complete
MSRIAKNPINIPEKTEINISEKKFSVKGDHGELSINIPNGYEIEKESNTVVVKTKNDDLKESPNWGTIRALIANAIIGVSQGFTKNLELNGTGYKAMIAGNALKLSLGYSHDINYQIPKEVKIQCPKPNLIKIFSHDKELLGKVASEIRSYRKPEPFKGKGIKYENEYIFRKEGKKK